MKKILNPSGTSRGRLARFAQLALLLVASAGVHAQGMSIALKGAAEVPPVTTAASGSGQIAVLPDHTVSGSIKVTGIAATAAHIHEGAAGKNGPVAIPLTKGPEDTFTVPPGAKLSDAQYASYLAGDLYVNVHSAANPGGEIRAQLKPAEAAKAPMRSGY